MIVTFAFKAIIHKSIDTQTTTKRTNMLPLTSTARLEIAASMAADCKSTATLTKKEKPQSILFVPYNTAYREWIST